MAMTLLLAETTEDFLGATAVPSLVSLRLIYRLHIHHLSRADLPLHCWREFFSLWRSF